MGEPCQKYWFTDMEIQDYDLFNQSHKIVSLDDEDQIFQEIMQLQQSFSSDSEPHSPNNQTKLIEPHSPNNQTKLILSGGGGDSGGDNNDNDFTMLRNNESSNLVIKSNNSNFIFSQQALEKPVIVTASTTTITNTVVTASPATYILSFDDSTVVAATGQTYSGKQPYHGEVVGSGGACLPSKEVSEKHDNIEPNKANPTTRKGRSSEKTLDHIMTERKRRRELTESFIALSATIPGLKKMDKATILSEGITHVKRLKERVRELEEQYKKRRVESVSFVHQRLHIATDKGTTSCAMNSDDCYRNNIIEELPIVKARVYKKDVLLRIHCNKQSGIMLKILDHLNSLDLSTISNSVLPFGTSTFDITIIAQMGDKFNVTTNDLVKNLRLALLQSI